MGKGGEVIREASDIEARENANVQIKMQDSIVWLVQILCFIADMIGLFMYGDKYKAGIYERSMPNSFRKEYDNKGLPKQAKQARGKSIKDLHNSPILKDKRYFD